MDRSAHDVVWFAARFCCLDGDALAITLHSLELLVNASSQRHGVRRGATSVAAYVAELRSGTDCVHTRFEMIVMYADGLQCMFGCAGLQRKTMQ
jgi:hypothetical protein